MSDLTFACGYVPLWLPKADTKQATVAPRRGLSFLASLVALDETPQSSSFDHLVAHLERHGYSTEFAVSGVTWWREVGAPDTKKAGQHPLTVPPAQDHMRILNVPPGF